MPFTTVDENGFPVPVLAQIDHKDFEICVPFKFRHKQQDPWTTVPKGKLSRRTDLASVPGFLLWLVPRYGAHTLAALVHDQLVKHPPSGGRVKADTIFRDLLGELNVPWIRRWLMWTAVSLGTTWHRGAQFRLRLVLWFVVVVCASAFTWQHAVATMTSYAPSSWLLFGDSVASDLSIVAGASILLAPRFGLGLLAGCAAMFLFVPSLAVGIFTGVYLLFEKLARVGLSAYNAATRVGLFSPVDNVPAVMTLAPPAGAHATVCPPLASSHVDDADV